MRQQAPVCYLSATWYVCAVMNIEIVRLQLSVTIGCTEQERAFPQIIDVDVKMNITDERSMQSDNLHDTVDYMEVIDEVVSSVQTKEFALLESFVRHIGETILSLSSIVDSVHVTATKRVSQLTECVRVSSEISR